MAAEMMSRVFSPYDLNPSGTHPLSELLADMVYFDCLANSPVRLLIAATNLRTGSGNHERRSAEASQAHARDRRKPPGKKRRNTR